MHRRWAVALGVIVTLVFIGWDFGYSAGDPVFAVTLNAVVWNRCLTALMILPALGLAWTKRFEQDEHFANAVLVVGLHVNFLFYCRGFLLVPYPYDYMFFFMGMFINVVCSFALFRLRARPTILLMCLCLVAAALTFGWNVQLKAASLSTYSAQIYLWVALSFLSTIALVGFVVSNLLERTIRHDFLKTAALATSNTALVAHSEKVQQLNLALESVVLRIKQESDARARVLAAASHDLRQPLHALSIYSALLVAEPDPAPDTLREVGTNIDQIARSLGMLLHGLLDLSQLSSGHYVVHLQEVALDQLLAGICTEFEAAAIGKDIFLHRQLEPVVMHADALAISRIVRNLIDNAIKYTDRGAVSIRLSQEAHWVTVSVADTGKGIPLDEQSRVFEEFYQLENDGRDRARGVGLGLAIVHRLVSLIGATITLESAPLEGSRFAVQIPRPDPVSAQANRAAGPALNIDEPRRSLQCRVHVLDDEPDILRSMSALLQSWGCTVVTSQNVAEAASQFERSERPDLLIADLRLRDSETGLSFAQRMLRTHGEFPILFVTGETSSQVLAEVNAAGWRMLHKPVDVQVLREEIEQLISRPPT